MTLGQFRPLVLNYCTIKGRVYAQELEVVTLNALITKHLQGFTERTHLLYKDQVQFTLVQNVKEYSARDLNTFTSLLCYVENMYILGSALLNFDVRTGPVSVDELRQEIPNYILTTAAKPSRWFTTPPYYVNVWPAPDAATITSMQASPTQTFVSGYILHPALVADSDTLLIPDEHHDTAAQYVSAKLMNPQADDELVLKLMGAFGAEAREEMERLMGRNEKARNRAYSRGRRNGWRSLFS